MLLWYIYLFQEQKSSSETREYKNIYVNVADEGMVKSFKDSFFI